MIDGVLDTATQFPFFSFALHFLHDVDVGLLLCANLVARFSPDCHGLILDEGLHCPLQDRKKLILRADEDELIFLFFLGLCTGLTPGE